MTNLGSPASFIPICRGRITLDGDHFYVELVFYHTILKCFVLLNLKVRKLTHEDLGQFQLYLNYYQESSFEVRWLL